MKATPPKASQPLSGPQKALRKLGLLRPIDLVLHLPLRYEDETRLVPLAQAGAGRAVQFEGVVTHHAVRQAGTRQLLVTVNDGGIVCQLLFFHFYPGQQKALAVGQRIRVRGELQDGLLGLQMLHPAFRAATTPLPQSLTPVYPTVAGLPQAYLRRAIQNAFRQADLEDTLTAEVLGSIGLERPWNLREALSFLHEPPPDADLDAILAHTHPAWRRLKAEELLAQQISQCQARLERSALHAQALQYRGDLPARLLAALPFDLTGAQRRAWAEVERDLARTQPMHRLLQGDVGSGKTVVAALAALACLDASAQCALMVPTEILAEQHRHKLAGWLEPLGARVVWLYASLKAKERRAVLQQVASGEAGLVVGTHALLEQPVVFKNLALAIIDEQHRFGVAQRLALREKCGAQGREPHLLMMTATPIPRTLAMSYYADLDVSTLDERPPGRTPVVTRLLHASRRAQVIERIRLLLAQGRQVYWVCPLIEDASSDAALRNATDTHAELGLALPGVMVGLLHSRMPTADKRAVMSLFVEGQMGVLVSTTVIEVGVDVPNASLMVIEHAERFGLSQLHQLRGRVGRGAAASACVLLYATADVPRLGETARERLKTMVQTSDGFEIARRDLALRGPGEFLGARQSGDAMLRFAQLELDSDLLDWARDQAPRLLQLDPERALRHMHRWLGRRAEFLKV